MNRRTRIIVWGAAAALVVAGGAVTIARTSDADEPGPIVAATEFTGPPPAPPRTCGMSLLPVPDRLGGTVTAADPTGRIIVGQSYLDGGHKQILMWRDGKVRKLPIVGSLTVLTDVNSRATAVGMQDSPVGPAPMAYHGGAATMMATGGADGGEAAGVNEAGTIAGTLGQHPHSGVPARWAAPGSEPERLPLPDGYRTGHATDIDEDGTIVGDLGDRDEPYVWFPNGEHRPLPLPDVDGEAATSGSVRAVRNGWAIGEGDYSAEGGYPSYRSVRWNLRTGEVMVFDRLTRLVAVNAYGWWVGAAEGAILRTATTVTPIVGQKGKTIIIENPPPATHAATISDNGRTIAGQTPDDERAGTAVPAVWRCT
ncbi:hypothetical protein [Virgisporangium ochraceum]|uniref:Uncharacterized protein n=1 Tax=Virgisporangium ochraceum TaxID=65505 RepID=A0A8J4EEP6_9ACTN|nr:hypothetical protein [Virgisporangium ochraceum]GIJ69237.1 hypothetical protein Voc01_041540 [Virgisporangium ochraceum]